MTSLRPDTLKVYRLDPNLLSKRVVESKQTKAKEILVLPKLFRLAGYRTYGIGKLFHETEFRMFDAPDVWTEPMWTWVKGLDRPSVFPKPYVGSWITFPEVEDDFFTDGQAAKLAAGLLSDKLNKDTSSPWFLAVGLWKPHLPWSVPKKYFDAEKRKFPAYHNDQQTKGLSASVYALAKGSGCGEVGWYKDTPKKLHAGVATTQEMQDAVWAYHASASYMDEQMGLILQALDASEAAQNTLVVLIGDHGFHLGDHGLFGKHTNFEQSTRVPLMIRPPLGEHEWDGVRGMKSAAPVELLDLMPTLYDLARISVDLSEYRQWQGVSLRPIVENPASGFVKQAAVSQYHRGYGSAKRWGYSVRTTRYRYTIWERETWKEVYDYLTDEWETMVVEDDEVVRLLSQAWHGRNEGEGIPPFDFEDRHAMLSKPVPQYP